jgi:hypothetical protein
MGAAHDDLLSQGLAGLGDFIPFFRGRSDDRYAYDIGGLHGFSQVERAQGLAVYLYIVTGKLEDGTKDKNAAWHAYICKNMNAVRSRFNKHYLQMDFLFLMSIGFERYCRFSLAEERVVKGFIRVTYKIQNT